MAKTEFNSNSELLELSETTKKLLLECCNVKKPKFNVSLSNLESKSELFSIKVCFFYSLSKRDSTNKFRPSFFFSVSNKFM